MKPRVQNQEKSDDLSQRVENGSSSRFTHRVVLCVFLLVVVAMLGLSVFLFVDSRNKIIHMEKQLREFKEQCTRSSIDNESEHNHRSHKNDDTHEELDRRVKRRARGARRAPGARRTRGAISARGAIRTRGAIRAQGAQGATGITGVQSKSGRDGSEGGRGGRVQPSGHYIRWGKISCSVGSFINGLSGIISTLHDSNDRPVAGADVVCLPTSNEVSSQSLNSETGYSLQPLHFRLDSVNPSAYRSAATANLKCAFCSHSGSTTMTLVGKTRCPQYWLTIYKGVYVSGSGVGGTTSSICLEFDSRYMSRSTSSHAHAVFSIRTSSAFTSASKQIPCIVCSA